MSDNNGITGGPGVWRLQGGTWLNMTAIVSPFRSSVARLMICMSGRFVPAMALMTACIEARHRGGFMSVNSSVQQLAAGLAAL